MKNYRLRETCPNNPIQCKYSLVAIRKNTGKLCVTMHRHTNTYIHTHTSHVYNWEMMCNHAVNKWNGCHTKCITKDKNSLTSRWNEQSCIFPNVNNPVCVEFMLEAITAVQHFISSEDLWQPSKVYEESFLALLKLLRISSVSFNNNLALFRYPVQLCTERHI